MLRKHSLVASFALIVAGFVLMTGVSAPASSTFTVLHNFDNTGYFPVGNLIFDSKGNIYGTTAQGGLASPNCRSDCGVVFELSPSGGSWTYKTIYSFTGGADGGDPQGNFVIDKTGNLYGANCLNGASNAGTVFKLSPSNIFSVLYTFTGGLDGSCPTGAMAIDALGNLYGTAFHGGASNAGTLFKLTPTGTLTVLYTFAGGADGQNPDAALMILQIHNGERIPVFPTSLKPASYTVQWLP